MCQGMSLTQVMQGLNSYSNTFLSFAGKAAGCKICVAAACCGVRGLEPTRGQNKG